MTLSDKIYEWTPNATLEEQKNGAYWERNMLALRYADGYYYDLVVIDDTKPHDYFLQINMRPRYEGWSRVLTLDRGRLTFHIPDDFDVGDLYQVKSNWDGHTTKEKWLRVMSLRGIK